jgi:mono/diheme cytochrome c family protein
VNVAAFVAQCASADGTAPAGCGAQQPAQATGGTPEEQGKALFASQGCGSCHTLGAAGSSGNVGPNLDDAKPTFDKVVTQVTNGGGGMPAFKGRLTDAQIKAVATFVSKNAGK